VSVTVRFRVNGTPRSLTTDPQRRLLDVLREELQLTGTKYGCGEGQCGACLVYLDGEPARSCLLPVKAADGKSVNNVLGFPGIFRGAVDAYASRITHEMLMAAAQTIADMTPAGELVPSPLDKKVYRAVARAVAQTAIEQGIARADYVPYVEE